jgi:hypothetical protein
MSEKVSRELSPPITAVTSGQPDRLERVEAALSWLVICARTSGGAAGPDPQLMDACDQAEFILSSATPVDGRGPGIPQNQGAA